MRTATGGHDYVRMSSNLRFYISQRPCEMAQPQAREPPLAVVSSLFGRACATKAKHNG